MKTPNIEIEHNVGDRIKCWTPAETIRKQMWLAKEGYICRQAADDDTCLIVTEIRKGEE